MAVRVKPKNVQDIQEYVNDLGNDLEFSLVEKSQKVEARQVLSGSEEVRTVLADGTEETVNVAREGDWIVNNVGSPEKWVVGDETFRRKYFPKLDEGEKFSVFVPKGGPVLAVELKEDISFVAPWGEKQVIRKGGFLICDPNSPKDIYGIDREAFEKTYVRIDNARNNLDKDSSKRKSSALKF